MVLLGFILLGGWGRFYCIVDDNVGVRKDYSIA